MTAQIIPFPPRGPFAIHVKRIESCWLVLCRDHGWIHGDRFAAIEDANSIAAGFGVTVAVSS
jgi:hypothetical protein